MIKARKKCIFCGKMSLIQKSKLKEKNQGKFCSHKCAGKWSSKYKSGKNSPFWRRVKTTCFQCNKEIYKESGRMKKAKKHFCSNKCKNASLITGRYKNCLICNKEFYAFNSKIKSGNAKFCSQKCTGIWRTQHYVGANNWKWKQKPMECKICHKKYTVSLSKLKENKGHFCSHRCCQIWAIKYQKKKNTSIEVLIGKELRKNKITYKKQVPIEGIALVDFLLSNKIIIQCDGNYWHNLPRAKERDKRQNLLLKKQGYKVYRFWEKEILESPRNCINKISGLLNKAS